MNLIVPSRRRFLFGAAAVLAAPAIIRVAQLMPISVLQPEPIEWTPTRLAVELEMRKAWMAFGKGVPDHSAAPGQIFFRADGDTRSTNVFVSRGAGRWDALPFKEAVEIAKRLV